MVDVGCSLMSFLGNWVFRVGYWILNVFSLVIWSSSNLAKPNHASCVLSHASKKKLPTAVSFIHYWMFDLSSRRHCEGWCWMACPAKLIERRLIGRSLMSMIGYWILKKN